MKDGDPGAAKGMVYDSLLFKGPDFYVWWTYICRYIPEALCFPIHIKRLDFILASRRREPQVRGG